MAGTVIGVGFGAILLKKSIHGENAEQGETISR
jgi:hypothetical protein